MLAHRLRELLGDDVVAELFLVLHYPEIIVVTGTEQAVWENLVVSTATGYHPDRSATRRELVFPNFPRFDEADCLLEPFLENSGQSLLLFFGEGSSSAYFLACPFEDPVFVYGRWRTSSLLE